MQAGEKLSYQGSQVCLFPMDYLYATQVSGPGSYSHCCGHPVDWVGPSGNNGHDPLYAPFDCHLVYQNNYNSGNCRAYSSDAPVWTPLGLTYVTVAFTHDNNPPAPTSYSQGDLIYHTGDAGFAFGYHCHLDQSNAYGSQLVSYGYYCSPDIPFPCYALSDSQEPYDIFYLSGNETIVDTMGMVFQTWNQPPEPPAPSKDGMPLWMKYLTMRRQIFGW